MEDGGKDMLVKTYNNSNLTLYEDDGPYVDLSQIEAVAVTFIIMYLLLMVMAIFGNAAVCYTVISNHKMQTVVNYYIVNLAICDFMVGAFVLPVKLLELTAPAQWGILNDGLCRSTVFFQTVFVFASVLTLVATCVERYFAIVHPFESRIQQSKSRTLKILVGVWLLPCIGASPYLMPAEARVTSLSSEYGTIKRLHCFLIVGKGFRTAYFSLLFVFFYLIPLIFIAWTCLRITQCLLKNNVLCRESSLRRQDAGRKKVAKMVLIVVAAFTISWTPYFLISIVTQFEAFNYFDDHNYFFTMLCINFLAFINSSINPFIYVVMSSRFRNGFVQILRYAFCASTVLDNEGELLPEEQSARHPFATFTKYHRQLVLRACGEPTQVSTDSLPTESPAQTLTFHGNPQAIQLRPLTPASQRLLNKVRGRDQATHLKPLLELKSRSMVSFGHCNGHVVRDKNSDFKSADKTVAANMSRARSESFLGNVKHRCPIDNADKGSKEGSPSISSNEMACRVSSSEVIVHQEQPEQRWAALKGLRLPVTSSDKPLNKKESTGHFQLNSNSNISEGDGTPIARYMSDEQFGYIDSEV